MKRAALNHFASSKNSRSTENKALTFRVPTQQWKQLKMLALNTERSAHNLLLEALQDLLSKYTPPQGK